MNKKELIENILTSTNGLNTTTCHVYYSNYDNVNHQLNYFFALNRNIIIRGKVQSVLSLKFKNIKINTPLNLPFNIPTNYKIVQ